MASINPFIKTKRLVLKIGSALLVDGETGALRGTWLQSLSADIALQRRAGIDVIIVSSGAIALGQKRLNLPHKPITLAEKQACAAAGQSLLTRAYERVLEPHNLMTAQALLTLNDTEDRRRYLNARSTLETLLRFGCIPVINENDTVATDEIRYGDNDRLAARTAQMLAADTLILLSDIDGLYTADPRHNTTAEHLPIIEAITPDIMAMGGTANSRSNVGTGGMATKLMAAHIAVDAGCHMCVMDGAPANPLQRLAAGAQCSWFKAADNPVGARSQWILGALKARGAVHIDAGAVTALSTGKSLLAAGIKTVTGPFQKGDAIRVVGPDGIEIARGLSAYSYEDAHKILGLKSSDIISVLGYDNGSAVIHRDNLVMIR